MNPDPSFKRPTRNPGPTWGYRFLRNVDRWVPRPVMDAGLWTGSAIACANMHPQRQHSRDYLRLVLGREPSTLEVVDHFYRMAQSLMLKFRFSRGIEPEFSFSDDSPVTDFLALCKTESPVLFGTMHIGHSDLMGCVLARLGRQVSMVRLRVENSDDTRWLEEMFQGSVRFLWVNEPEEVLFRIKQAMEARHALALQCDRIEYGARSAVFDFLGRRMRFPVTVYHLSALFQAPVVYSFAIPQGRSGIQVHVSSIFDPTSLPASEVVPQGYAHFQRTLDQLSAVLREHPFAWFNFVPLPEVRNERVKECV